MKTYPREKDINQALHGTQERIGCIALAGGEEGIEELYPVLSPSSLWESSLVVGM